MTSLFRHAVVLLTAYVVLLVATVTYNSTRWIDSTFPGFLVMGNRVVASIALPWWSGGRPADLFQHQVVAVDGVPVADARAVYERASARAAGAEIVYTLRAPDGARRTAVVPVRPFSAWDFNLLFGAYLLNGVAFLATGILVVVLAGRSAAAYGLLAQSITTGVFIVTAVDLYGPHWFFRLHVTAESFLAAGFIHLALVFPTDRIRRRRHLALAAVYLPFAALAIAYQFALGSPSAYTAIHLVATATHGLGGLALIAAVIHDFRTSPSVLVRRRISIVTLGTLAGFGAPGALMAASALQGGSIPLNAGALTAFLFPVSLGYAIVQRDLFDIDIALRRAATYVTVVFTLVWVYFGALWAFGRILPSADALARLPALTALLNLGMLFLVLPIKTRVQRAVDRVFFRRSYDSERVLAVLSHTLAATHALADVLGETRRVFDETVQPTAVRILLRERDGRYLEAGAPADYLDVPPELVERLARGDILTRYEWDDGSGREIPALWRSAPTDLLIPIRSGEVPIALIALGPRGSGRVYSPLDAAFLGAVASQVALAITNAQAFSRLETLNATLEGQVRERTAALQAANRDLSLSIADLRTAYEQLERNQTSLVRADRLATLGRLAAGMAHEVNTPLGAVINELSTLEALGREYADSIDDPEVSQQDHRAIASELITTTEAATRWARKAADFIRKVKLHGRESAAGTVTPFLVESVVTETRSMLAHRLRAASCELIYEEIPRGVSLVGDPGRLGQVLMNLVGNAIDAYEETNQAVPRIVVEARRDGDTVTLDVRDWAGGMPPEVAARIFDELYTTKDPGRGTGLGLWIARNLVEQHFGGTLVVETAPGTGSCFTITVAAARDARGAAPAAAAAG
jgi:signal transduction histidine kinase